MRRVLFGALLMVWLLPGLAYAVDQNASLLEAVRQGDANKVKSLLSKGADANAKDENGRTVLMEAAYWGRTDVVKILLDKGADINAKDKNDNTILINTARPGHVEIINSSFRLRSGQKC